MSTVDRLVHEALRRRVFPSAVLLVARRGEVVLHRAFGAAREDTVYDVASLTKAVATSVAAMLQCDRGLLDLDAPVAEHLPAFRGAARVWHLLAHAAGLPAHRPYFATCRGRAAIVRAAAREPAVYPAGTRSLYSDLGFILLGAIVEKIARRRLDRFLAHEVYVPLGLRDTLFVPLVRRRPPVRAPRDFAPTGRSAWRRRALRGEVHDDNAAAMGGVAGHAGLFSTAADLHVIARALVAAWRSDDGPVSRATIRRFWRRPLRGSTWCLGWDSPSERGSQAGLLSPRRARGHLAFTGCSIWIDPARASWTILLTNRTWFGADAAAMRRFRPRLHDVVVRSFA